MVQVELKPLLHRGQHCIGIYFGIDSGIQALLRGTRLVKFSMTHTCWYAPYTEENLRTIISVLQDKARVIRMDFGSGPVHKDAANKKPASGVISKTLSPVPAKGPSQDHGQWKRDNTPKSAIHACNAHILPALEQRLKLRGYSPHTIRVYSSEVAVFLRILGAHPADELPVQRLKDYFQYCLEKLRLSENTLHSRINAIKYYYEQVLGRERFFWDIPRPKKHKLLPKVLSKEEVIRLLKAIDNLKHKTLVMMGYACGLRVSEIIALELGDIDEGRRLLYIRRAKGKKDRVVSLSPVMLVMLRDYLAAYKPKRWVFEGQQPGSPYSIRSLQSIVATAKAKAGITKPGSTHLLRHSFATHLIEKGTDVVFIQKLLGHNDIKTTLRYLHVTNKDLTNILSPIEDIRDFL